MLVTDTIVRFPLTSTNSSTASRQAPSKNTNTAVTTSHQTEEEQLEAAIAASLMESQSKSHSTISATSNSNNTGNTTTTTTNNNNNKRKTSTSSSMLSNTKRRIEPNNTVVIIDDDDDTAASVKGKAATTTTNKPTGSPLDDTSNSIKATTKHRSASSAPPLQSADEANSAECVLQIRNGSSSLLCGFPASTTMQQVWQYVDAHRNEHSVSFHLAIAYPRRVFADDDDSLTLADAGKQLSHYLCFCFVCFIMYIILLDCSGLEGRHALMVINDWKNKSKFFIFYCLKKDNNVSSTLPSCLCNNCLASFKLFNCSSSLTSCTCSSFTSTAPNFWALHLLIEKKKIWY